MTDWFARPFLNVTDVEALLPGFTLTNLASRAHGATTRKGRARVAQVDRQGCTLILANNLAPKKIGKGVMFISGTSSLRRASAWDVMRTSANVELPPVSFQMFMSSPAGVVRAIGGGPEIEGALPDRKPKTGVGWWERVLIWIVTIEEI